MPTENLPWIKDPNFVEAIPSYYAYYSTTLFEAYRSQKNPFLKLFNVLFSISSKIRWKLNFFHLRLGFWFKKKVNILKRH